MNIIQNPVMFLFNALKTAWVNTPAFDRVARDGILMTGFYTPNSKSAPSKIKEYQTTWVDPDYYE